MSQRSGLPGATPLTQGRALPRGDMGRSRGGASWYTFNPAVGDNGFGGPAMPATPSTPMSDNGYDDEYGGFPGAGGGDGDGDGGGGGDGDGPADADEAANNIRQAGGRDGDAIGADEIIWGTTVQVKKVYNIFYTFVQEFKNQGEFSPFYIKQFEIAARTGRHIVNIDCSHFYGHFTRDAILTRDAKELYLQLVSYPQEVIPVLDMVIEDLFVQMYPERAEVEGRVKLQVRVYNLCKSKHSEHNHVKRMRELDPEHVDQLVTIKGMVIRCSPIIPDLKVAYYRCVVCGTDVDRLINMGRIDEPQKCDNCHMKGCMELVHNRCAFTDKQLIRVQESSDEIPEGETPYTCTLFAFDELVDTVRPGDRPK